MIVMSAVAAFLAMWLVIPLPGSNRVHAVSSSSIAPRSFATTLRMFMSRLHGQSQRVRTIREDSIAAIGALAAELRAGATPSQAFIASGGIASGGSSSVWPHTHAAALHHGDIAAALLADSQEAPQLSPLRQLNACLRVGIHSGSGLATSVSRLAQSLREAQETRYQLEAELAGPRATARMLAFLPVVGIGLGYLMGAQPLTWLISSPLGWVTLVTGIGLTTLGVWWTSVIATRVECML
jgi:tight adherence protein B